jgi:large conductance mechanosensitive channel
MGLFRDFRIFLKEYNVLSLAIALIIGLAATTLVNSLVNNIIMPIISPLIPGGDWQSSTLILGPVILGWGPLLAALINFLIIAIVVFFIARYALKEEKKKTK